MHGEDKNEMLQCQQRAPRNGQWNLHLQGLMKLSISGSTASAGGQSEFSMSY